MFLENCNLAPTEPTKGETLSGVPKWVPVKSTPQKLKSFRIGRNSPCPCRSGKKFKKCCRK